MDLFGILCCLLFVILNLDQVAPSKYEVMPEFRFINYPSVKFPVPWNPPKTRQGQQHRRVKRI